MSLSIFLLEVGLLVTPENVTGRESERGRAGRAKKRADGRSAWSRSDRGAPSLRWNAWRSHDGRDAPDGCSGCRRSGRGKSAGAGKVVEPYVTDVGPNRVGRGARRGRVHCKPKDGIRFCACVAPPSNGLATRFVLARRDEGLRLCAPRPLHRHHPAPLPPPQATRRPAVVHHPITTSSNHSKFGSEFFSSFIASPRRYISWPPRLVSTLTPPEQRRRTCSIFLFNRKTPYSNRYRSTPK